MSGLSNKRINFESYIDKIVEDMIETSIERKTPYIIAHSYDPLSMCTDAQVSLTLTDDQLQIVMKDYGEKIKSSIKKYLDFISKGLTQ